ncbi:kinetochore protein NDC80 [Fistulifera solaris]|uniref:Kinetochore protein NDC80 n=1 Tax=Fistulifera solaris TaxID=1519565 RepID=A0A1Z5JMH3_FISSO|nr:kinetochore protein NDC80 [Fistulifera solaris]|eukprot:GAX15062.1 kinetochore protein NDC80 [Fistulifera solaris]
MPSSFQTPNRRMTLGPIPTGSANQRRRMSVGGPAAQPSPSANKIPKPPRSRKSMLPRIDGRENMVPPSPGVTATTASSRRKSMGGRASIGGRPSLIPPPAAAAKVDTRPITEKAFQQKCIKDLLTFLLDFRYDSPVSTKTLTRPSAKDFRNICTFMLRLIDPNFQKGELKFEDEVFLSFKCLGYPFNVSKTALVAAGSPHTWPALLAALAWLVEHIQCKLADKENVEDKPFESYEDLDAKASKMFFEYLFHGYEAYMNGDAKLREELEFQLAEGIDRDNQFLIQEVERVTELNATIVERIADLTNDSQDLSSYTQKREEYATELEQYHDLVRQMDEHKCNLEQKIKERTAELEKTNEQLEKMNGHIRSLKDEISNQKMSVDDLRALENELKGLNEAMDRSCALRDKRKEALTASQSDLDEVCNALDAAIVDYNSKLSDLQFVPTHGPALVNLKAVLKKDKLLAKNDSVITGVAFKDEVAPKLDDIIASINAKIDETKEKYQDMLDKVQRSHDECKAADAQLHIVKEKTAKCEKTMEDEEETHKAKLAVRQREVDAMESKVASRRDPIALEEQIAAFQRQCAELEALQLEYQVESACQVKALQDEIDRSAKLMMENENYWQSKMKEVGDYWSEKVTNVARVKVPELSNQ